MIATATGATAGPPSEVTEPDHGHAIGTLQGQIEQASLRIQRGARDVPRDPAHAHDRPVLFHAHDEDALRRGIHGNTARPATHRDCEEDLSTPAVEGREGAVTLVGNEHPVRGAIYGDPVRLSPHGDPQSLPEVSRVEAGDEAVAFVVRVETARRGIHRAMPGAAHEPDR